MKSGTPGEVLGVVGAHRLLAVEDLAGRHDLVARVVERRDDAVEVARRLRGRVGVEDRLPRGVAGAEPVRSYAMGASR